MSNFRRRITLEKKKYGIEFSRNKRYVVIGTVTNKTRIDVDVDLYGWNTYDGFFNYGQDQFDFTRYSDKTRSRWGGETLELNNNNVLKLHLATPSKPIHIILSMNKGITSLNGTVYYTHTQKTFSKTNITLGTAGVGFTGKVYSFSIWENDVLIDVFKAKNIDGVDCFVGKHTREIREVKKAS